MSASRSEFDTMNGDDLGIDMLMRGGGGGEGQTTVVNVGDNDDDDGEPRLEDDDDDDDGDLEEDDDLEDDDKLELVTDDDEDRISIPPQERRHTHPSAGSGGQTQKEYSAAEIADMKQELLYQMDRLEKKGVKLAKKFTMASSYEDMNAELERIKRDRELMASLRFQRMILSTCVTGIEFLNTRYDPFDVKLDGWSESILENMGDYDDIFEELHDKYKGKARMAPELKLMFMLGGSAVQFHLTNTMFNSALPGFSQVMKQNPDLMRQFSQATMAAAAGPQASPAAAGGGFFGGLGKLFGGGGGTAPTTPPTARKPESKMRGPSDVNDMLRDMEANGSNDRSDVISTISDGDSTGGRSLRRGKKAAKAGNRKTMQI